MGAMKQLLNPTLVSVIARPGDVLYDASVARERRILQALETQEVLARAVREPQARRFPRKHRPMAVRHPLWMRVVRAVWTAVKQEWAR
jgi:hypothetical protein